MGEYVYLKIILSSNTIHTSINEAVCAFLYDIESSKTLFFNFKHPDLNSYSSFSEFSKLLIGKKIFVLNKKKYKYLLNSHELLDINVIKFIKDGDILDEKEYDVRLSHIKFDNEFYNLIVPLSKHEESFENEIRSIIEKVDVTEYHQYSFSFFNNFLSDTLYEIEKNGLKVNLDIFNSSFKKNYTNDIVYSEYNIYNRTGRPTNHFDGINYVALNKENGCRKSFVSRYENGYIMVIDFTAFHPSIISHLIDYKLPNDKSIYEYLATKYFNIDYKDITKEHIKISKKITLINLYSNISDKYIDIEFFNKVEQLKNKYWKLFSEKKYIQTPIYKRKITDKHIVDANKNKLFAYLIQALETEYAINSLYDCIKFVTNKNIKPILYVYDSVVFDVDSRCDSKDIIELINIFKSKKFNIKTYIGKNYNEIELI